MCRCASRVSLSSKAFAEKRTSRSSPCQLICSRLVVNVRTCAPLSVALVLMEDLVLSWTRAAGGVLCVFMGSIFGPTLSFVHVQKKESRT